MKLLRIVLPVCTGLMLIAWHLGFRINSTPSLPIGVYRIIPGVVAQGDLGAYCLDAPAYIALAQERGYLGAGSCPSGLRPLLKKVAGVPGDLIRIDSGNRIIVNNAPQPNSAARISDHQGRPMPVALKAGTIPAGQALLLADHEGSFDSRYFGFAPLVCISRVEPVFITHSKGEKNEQERDNR